LRAGLRKRLQRNLNYFERPWKRWSFEGSWTRTYWAEGIGRRTKRVELWW